MVTATDAAGNTSDATPVVIIVSDVNEDPTADDGTGAVTAGDGMAATGNVNAMDVDDGDTHTFSVETQAAFGMLSVDEAGEWSYTVDDANADVVALAQGATMEDSATVMVDDGNGGTTTATVSITITGANASTRREPGATRSTTTMRQSWLWPKAPPWKTPTLRQSGLRMECSVACRQSPLSLKTPWARFLARSL
jgi:VCBS repeat-containing protein